MSISCQSCRAHPLFIERKVASYFALATLITTVVLALLTAMHNHETLLLSTIASGGATLTLGLYLLVFKIRVLATHHAFKKEVEREFLPKLNEYESLHLFSSYPEWGQSATSTLNFFKASQKVFQQMSSKKPKIDQTLIQWNQRKEAFIENEMRYISSSLSYEKKRQHAEGVLKSLIGQALYDRLNNLAQTMDTHLTQTVDYYSKQYSELFLQELPLKVEEWLKMKSLSEIGKDPFFPLLSTHMQDKSQYTTLISPIEEALKRLNERFPG